MESKQNTYYFKLPACSKDTRVDVSIKSLCK